MDETLRQQLKDSFKYYRTAAARLSGGTVGLEVAVNLTADHDGAFVECVVWVPREEMEKERDHAGREK